MTHGLDVFRRRRLNLHNGIGGFPKAPVEGPLEDG